MHELTTNPFLKCSSDVGPGHTPSFRVSYSHSVKCMNRLQKMWSILLSQTWDYLFIYSFINSFTGHIVLLRKCYEQHFKKIVFLHECYRSFIWYRTIFWDLKLALKECKKMCLCTSLKPLFKQPAIWFVLEQQIKCNAIAWFLWLFGIKQNILC